ADGIVQALASLPALTKPLVVRLDGNNAELGRRILADAALPLVELVDSMDAAAGRAAALCAALAAQV
ncbi:MAG: succinate--CoA ligase subunit beta, partial [Glaciihabitans sp.]|nr:succinate--CoA ligase subunit beta [Glaciihabitans sp.]